MRPDRINPKIVPDELRYHPKAVDYAVILMVQAHEQIEKAALILSEQPTVKRHSFINRANFLTRINNALFSSIKKVSRSQRLINKGVRT